MSTGAHKGMVSVTCANPYTENWVTTQVSHLRPWEGVLLEVIPFDHLPGPFLCRVFVPLVFFDNPLEILASIVNQNPELRTGLWDIFGSERQTEGWFLTLGVDQESVKALHREKYMAFLGSRKIWFKFSKAELERAQIK